MHEHPTYRNAPTSPPSDPWQTTGVYVVPPHTQVMPTEELGSHGPRRRRRRVSRTVLLGVGVVVALLAGSITYASVSYWYGWLTTQPEDVLPASVSAFARLDFSPGLGQQLKIANLAKKFPPNGGEDAVASAKRNLIDDLGLAPLEYDADIKGWFADRIGLAQWPAADDPLCSLVALASKDDGAATAALTKVRQRKGTARFGFAAHHGYLVYARCPHADSQTAAETAVAQARTQPLADKPAFSDDLSALPAGQTIVAWADLRAVTQSTFSGLDPGLRTTELTGVQGTAFIGVQATNDGIDARYRVHSGAHRTAPTRDVVAALGALPGGTLIGVSADLSGFPRPANTNPTGYLGLFDAILGSTVSLSVTDVSGSTPAVRLVIRAADAGTAGSIASVLQRSGNPIGHGAVVSRTTDTVTISSGTDRPGTGTVADSPMFAVAMGDATAHPIVAAYADVTRIADTAHLTRAEAAQIAPVKAAGFSAGFDGDTLVGHVRIVIR